MELSNFKVVAIFIFSFLTVTTSYAQSTTSVASSAIVVTPIGITKTFDMDFGNIAVSTSPGTVILAPSGSGTRTTTGGVTLPATTGWDIGPAAFDVTGEGDYTYSITLPSVDYIITNTTSGGAETMAINNFTSNQGQTGELTNGYQSLMVGATLNVSGSQVAGTYTNATGFDVTVNYN